MSQRLVLMAIVVVLIASVNEALAQRRRPRQGQSPPTEGAKPKVRSFGGGNQQPGSGANIPESGFGPQQDGGGFTPRPRPQDGGFRPQFEERLRPADQQFRGDFESAERSTEPPPRVFSQGVIRLSMPTNQSGEVAYQLNEFRYAMGPGQQQAFREDRSWRIRFDRGGGFGVKSYALVPGIYTFRRRSDGWELLKRRATTSTGGGFSSSF